MSRPANRQLTSAELKAACDRGDVVAVWTDATLKMRASAIISTHSLGHSLLSLVCLGAVLFLDVDTGVAVFVIGASTWIVLVASWWLRR